MDESDMNTTPSEIEPETPTRARDLASIKIYYETAKGAIATQIDEVKSANLRSAGLLGFTSLYVGRLGQDFNPGWLAVVWVVVTAMAIGLAVAAYWTAQIKTAPKLAFFREEMLGLPETQLLETLADYQMHWCELNTPILRQKLTRFKAALVCFAASVALLAVGTLWPAP